jgi:hypothetical protein
LRKEADDRCSTVYGFKDSQVVTSETDLIEAQVIIRVSPLVKIDC